MYQDFAGLYDRFMQTIPAGEWADYAETLWKAHGLTPKLVLDLACGTGSLSLELAGRGYDMIASDMSPEMLTVGREKASEQGLQEQVLFLLQDMREFELYGTVDSILCTCDSLNYLLKEEELLKVFELAENYLEPSGLFLFDMNTEHKYRDVLGSHIFADTTDDAAFIWQNYYYEEEKLNEYAVTFFERKEPETGSRRGLFGRKKADIPEDGHYIRFEEKHLQKAYDPETVKHLLEQAHLKVEGVYDAFTLEPATASSERITFVAREMRKIPGDPEHRK